MRVRVAIMARAPVPGSCKTRLARTIGDGLAADIYRAMLLDTLAAYETMTGEVHGMGAVAALDSSDSADDPGQGDEHPATVVDDLLVMAAPENDGLRALTSLVPRGWQVREQMGDGFEERLVHAVQSLSRPGADGQEETLVILSGSDSPTVDLQSLRRFILAHRRSQNQQRAVMGPCVDGGYYLIGVSGGDVRLLQDMPWSTDQVAPETRRRCAALSIQLTELPQGADVDVVEDLRRLQRELRQVPHRAPRTAELLVGLRLEDDSTPSAAL